MPFNPDTVPPETSPDTGKPATTRIPGGFDPATAKEEPPPPSPTLQAARGVTRGLAGDVVGAAQVAGPILKQKFGMGWLTDPIARSSAAKALTKYANAPSQGFPEKAGRFVGGALPFMVQPELGLGTIPEAVAGGTVAGLVQPTESGSLESHLGGAAVGGLAGILPGLIGPGPARALMRQLGVRLTPGRQVPGGRTWEYLTSGLPFFNSLIGHGRQVSLDDFQRALYRDALETMPGSAIPNATGSAGLEQLRNTITTRLNTVLAGSSLPAGNVAALRGDMRNIMTNALTELNPPQLTRLGRIIADDIEAPIALNGGTLPGARLAGRNGVVARLNGRARGLWSSDDTQEKALGNVIDQLEEAVLNNADVPAGRGALDAARQAYARYKTLSRAGGGATAEGQIDPGSLLAELRRANPDVFARGGMRLQNTATQARRAGVPSVGETTPQVSRLETGLGVGAGGAAALLNPELAERAWPLAAAGIPAALYNRPGMTFAQLLAEQARRTGAIAGTAAGQVTPDMVPNEQ